MGCHRRRSACLLALAMGVAHAAEQEAELTLRFKPLFANVGKYPLLCGAVTQGAVTLDEGEFVTEKPSLRLDCSKTKDAVIGLGCYIHPDKVAAYRGRSVVFRVQVKWLSGRGDLTLQMRASGEKVAGTIAQQVKCRVEPGQWVPLELRAVVPPMAEANIVNFMVWLSNSSEPAVMLVDEPEIALAESLPAAAVPGGFAAYEATGAEPLALVRDGRPVAGIVVGETRSQTLDYALRELQEHLKLATGTELPVLSDGQPAGGPTIHLGATALSERLGLAPRFLAPDHWLVRRVGDALLLSGGDAEQAVDPAGNALAPCGTLYAVYEFLERVVGVRWYWPGELGRVVPERRTLEVGPVAWQGAPSYNTRFAFYSNPSDEDFTVRDSRVWWRRMRWGGLKGSPIGMHSFNAWPKRFGQAHPDWFALQRNGQRASQDPGGYVCFSNPEVLAQTVADVRAFFDAHPAVRYATVMPGDGDFECHCEQCQAQGQPDSPREGRWSRLVWSFVNKVAARIHESHPERVITCCAYSMYRQPPADVHLLPNVAVTLCTNYLPYVWRPNTKSGYLAELDAWAATGADIYVWDYWYARRQSGTHGAPSLFPRAMKEWFALEGGRVKGRVIELCEFYADGRSSHDWADWRLDALDMYVAMRLMWDLDQDIEALLSDYHRDLYGPAASLMRRFHDELEAAWSATGNKGGADASWDWSTCWLKTYPPELVARTMGLLREAEQMTRGQEPYHQRVARTLAGFLPFEAASRRYTGAITPPAPPAAGGR